LKLLRLGFESVLRRPIETTDETGQLEFERQLVSVKETNGNFS